MTQYNVKPETVQTIAGVVGAVKTKFEKAQQHAWLSLRQLGLAATKGEQVAASRVLLAMHRRQLLDQRREGKHGEALYRPSQVGWMFFSKLGETTPTDLYEMFGRREEKRLPNRCSTCGDEIKDRRTDATVCWGCELPNVRARHGMDHVLRTQAYLQTLRGGEKAQRREVKRVREVRRAWRAQQVATVPQTKQERAAEESARAPGFEAPSVPKPEVLPGMLAAVNERLGKLESKVEVLADAVGRLQRERPARSRVDELFEELKKELGR